MTKALHIDVGQVYSNIGEYLAANVLNLNIWRYPELAKISLPNSNLALEFLLSFNHPTAIALIGAWSSGITMALNFFESRRYKSVAMFCAAQYFLMNPLLYFIDGTYFVMGLYALIALVAIVVFLDKIVDSLNPAPETPAEGHQLQTD
jgi:hypothetical protein